MFEHSMIILAGTIKRSYYKRFFIVAKYYIHKNISLNFKLIYRFSQPFFCLKGLGDPNDCISAYLYMIGRLQNIGHQTLE
jgi:hypothetical protein